MKGLDMTTMGNTPRRLKQALQAALLRHGIEVRKTPAYFAPIPVFQLAVEALMARRGQQLRFVQVGANDGVFVDPLREYIISCGWQGVLIEPQPEVFKILVDNYAQFSDRLKFENVAISPNSHLKLYLPPKNLADGDSSHAYSVVSSDASVLARQIGVPEDQLRSVEVPGTTLDALLEQHGIREFDLLQIDAEGYDWEVLQTLTLGKAGPTLIQFETGHLDRNTLTTVAEYLNEAGYLIYYGGYQGDALAMKRDFFHS